MSAISTSPAHSLAQSTPSSVLIYAPWPAKASVPRRQPAWTALSLFVLAALFTLLNCAKPLHVDDAAYVFHAAQIAQHPSSPYDSVIYWDYQFQPGNHLLAPPVFLYWLAGAQAVLGDAPALWKLTLLPWHMLLVGSLFFLLRRWAAPLAMPLTWMTILSPALLPSANLMLDVPALTLSLAAVSLFVCACERGSWTMAILAGLCAGLAMQTKYSAFVTPAVLLGYGLIQRRRFAAAAAAGTAVAIFTLWECFVAVQHGESHFVAAAVERGGSFWTRFGHLTLPTAALTAALMPGVLFLGIVGWKRSGRWLATTVIVVGTGFLLLGAAPASLNELWRHPTTDRALIKLDELLYGGLTVMWWSVFIATIFGYWRKPHVGCFNGQRITRSVMATVIKCPWFLLLWLLLELVGAVTLSPFAASRRVLGITVVATLLIGSIVSRRVPPARLVWWATSSAVVLGLAVALVDVHEAQATEKLAEAAVQVAQIAQRDNPGGQTWFSGLWAFSFYATRHGLEPLEPNRSQLHPGDLLILTEQQMERIDFHVNDGPLVKVQVVTLNDSLPWSTLLCYYCGRTPVRHHEGPRLRLTVYRALADYVPPALGVLPPISATEGNP